MALKVRRNPHGYYWVKSRYSKPFLVRRAMKMAQAAIIAAQGVAHINAIAANSGIPATIAVAETALRIQQSIREVLL